MSAIALQAVRHGRALALAILVVVLVGVMLLVATTTGKTSSPGPSGPGGFDPQGPVTDAGVNPWAANDPALVTS